MCAAIQRLIDDLNLLPRLRANVRPPMTMEEHVERLEALYAKVKDQMPIEGVL